MIDESLPKIIADVPVSYSDGRYEVEPMEVYVLNTNSPKGLTTVTYMTDMHNTGSESEYVVSLPLGEPTEV